MRFLIVALILIFLSGCAPNGKAMNRAEVHFMLGVSYLQADEPSQALNEFLQAEEIEPDDAPLQAGLGQAYFAKKSYTEAEKHYLQALKLDKDNPKYENNLAALYMETKRWDDAIRYFHKAASNLLFSQPEVAWTGYGYAYFMKGDYLAAISAYKKALDQNWRYPQAYVRRGEAFDALGKPGKAIADYEQALKLYPNYSLAHYNLAITGMKLRKVDMAINHFSKVVDLAPDSNLANQAKSYLLVLK